MKGLIVLAASLIFLGVVGSSRPPHAQFEQAEVQCEEAVAHLAACCPELRPETFFCEHVVAVGCGSDRYPDFSETTSKFLRSLSCQEIHASDLCNTAHSLVVVQPSDSNQGGFL